jgi:ribonucleoside-diphosphate reductase alpha chain
MYQYVIDPIVKKLVDSGINPGSIEDSYSLDFETRVSFQAWLQEYVDHAISSTINIPAWGTTANNEGKVREFGEILMKYLPKMRGVTMYPDGARSGQPLTPVPYQEAISQIGQIFEEPLNICDITKGGSCGD